MSCLDRVVVATDSEDIADTVRGFGGEVCLTSPDHPSGTDRVAEVVGGRYGSDAEVVVNLQPDEPFLAASSVEAAVAAIRDGEEVATLAAPLTDLEELLSPAVVKVVLDTMGRALYFSRSPIPAARDGWPGSLETGGWLRHIGLYAYTRPALERWVALPVSPLEELEKLEQLRALAGGIDIHVSVVEAPETGIDTPEDLDRAERLLGKGSYV